MRMNDVNIEVSVKISDLIECLRDNKKKHLAEYEVARTEYFAALKRKLRDLSKSLKNEEFRKDNYNVNLNPPVNASDMYEQYIKMLSMSQETEMKISTHEYQCFVEDNWSWAIAAKTSNAFYSSGVMAR